MKLNPVTKTNHNDFSNSVQCEGLGWRDRYE